MANKKGLINSADLNSIRARYRIHMEVELVVARPDKTYIDQSKIALRIRSGRGPKRFQSVPNPIDVEFLKNYPGNILALLVNGVPHRSGPMVDASYAKAVQWLGIGRW
ncbi:hypothetical protein ACLOJK_011151 [Asimina triloba]